MFRQNNGIVFFPVSAGFVPAFFIEKLFVAEKLAPMESVISTSTSFVLKKYKQDGVIMEKGEEDLRLQVSP